MLILFKPRTYSFSHFLSNYIKLRVVRIGDFSLTLKNGFAQCARRFATRFKFARRASFNWFLYISSGYQEAIIKFCAFASRSEAKSSRNSNMVGQDKRVKLPELSVSDTLSTFSAEPTGTSPAYKTGERDIMSIQKQNKTVAVCKQKRTILTKVIKEFWRDLGSPLGNVETFKQD